MTLASSTRNEFLIDQGITALDDVTRIYRQLKSVRSKMKRHLKELHVISSIGSAEELDEHEVATRNLADTKTNLRKRFDKVTKRKGPYKMS